MTSRRKTSTIVARARLLSTRDGIRGAGGMGICSGRSRSGIDEGPELEPEDDGADEGMNELRFRKK